MRTIHARMDAKDRRVNAEIVARQAQIVPVREAQIVSVFCVNVELPIGSSSFSRCTADVYTDGKLTVTSIDTGDEMRVFPFGTWVSADVRDAEGWLLFSFNGVPRGAGTLVHAAS